MAQITYVKKAQQRYATVPVLDPETGDQKTTPVLNSDGTPKRTKSGRAIIRRLTVEDKSQPIDPYTCDHCHKVIKIGTSYKHVTPKSGPYGGSKRTRHADCPSWQVWELSQSLSARIAQIQFEAGNALSEINGDDESSATSAAEEIAAMIRELAEEKEEAAQNIEDGFGHETEMSSELRDIAEQLNGWADEVEGASFDIYPECEDEEDSGDVQIFETEKEDWAENARAAIQDAVDSSPI